MLKPRGVRTAAVLTGQGAPVERRLTPPGKHARLYLRESYQLAVDPSSLRYRVTEPRQQLLACISELRMEGGEFAIEDGRCA